MKEDKMIKAKKMIKDKMIKDKMVKYMEGIEYKKMMIKELKRKILMVCTNRYVATLHTVAS